MTWTGRLTRFISVTLAEVDHFCYNSLDRRRKMRTRFDTGVRARACPFEYVVHDVIRCNRLQTLMARRCEVDRSCCVVAEPSVLPTIIMQGGRIARSRWRFAYRYTLSTPLCCQVTPRLLLFEGRNPPDSSPMYSTHSGPCSTPPNMLTPAIPSSILDNIPFWLPGRLLTFGPPQSASSALLPGEGFF